MDWAFDVKKVTEDLILWTRGWFADNGKGCTAVIGISGGKDSTVAAAICVKALGKDRVIGVLMPNGVQKDLSDSQKVVDHLGIRSVTCNISSAVNAVTDSIHASGLVSISEQSLVNLPPRIRMVTLYAVSQSVNGRVINTCNLSENICGFSTLYGDHAGDVSVFDRLTVTEIRAIGHYLGLPSDLVDKIPSDGLTGKSDEDVYGFSYDELDRYIRTEKCENPTVKEKIQRRYQNGKFKLDLINFPHYDPALTICPQFA